MTYTDILTLFTISEIHKIRYCYNIQLFTSSQLLHYPLIVQTALFFSFFSTHSMHHFHKCTLSCVYVVCGFLLILFADLRNQIKIYIQRKRIVLPHFSLHNNLLRIQIFNSRFYLIFFKMIKKKSN